MDKKIGIISFKGEREKEDERIKKFQEEAEELDQPIKVFHFDKFFVKFSEGKNEVYYNEKKLDHEKLRAIIPIPSLSEDIFENMFFVRCLETKGIKSFNKSTPIKLTKNKIQSLFKLSRNGIPVIPSAINFSQFRLGPLFELMTNEKIICKTSSGSLGKGVGILESKISLISIIELMAAKGISPPTLLFQKFIAESAGKDMRIIVVGKKAIAAMRRKTEDDFRSNLSGLGIGTNVKNIPKNIQDIAVKAIKTLKLNYGGVDILMSKKGPLVIEVNANPGILIEEITGVNVTREILKYVIRNS